MSRAFVRESDQETVAEPLPELAISPHPNLVTAEGLRKIESQVRGLEASRRAAREASDPTTLARIARDLRYWTQRRATARVVAPIAAPEQVGFGVCVRLRLEDGSEQGFRLVGEDEGEPACGLLSWMSPLGQALMNRRVGDAVEVAGRRAEIVGLES